MAVGDINDGDSFKVAVCSTMALRLRLVEPPTATVMNRCSLVTDVIMVPSLAQCCEKGGHDG